MLFKNKRREKNREEESEKKKDAMYSLHLICMGYIDIMGYSKGGLYYWT